MIQFLAHVTFAVLSAMTPHCHTGDLTNCHYSDSVSVSYATGVVFAEVHHGIYDVTVYPR